MEGIFHHRKVNPWLILLLFCGISAFVLLNHGVIAFLVFSVIMCPPMLFILYLNHDAYLHVRTDSIQAKYHWFGKLHCSLDEIAFVLPQLNALTILLKNGKRHIIMGIANPWEVCSAIRRRTFSLETESLHVLCQRSEAVRKSRKRDLIWTASGCVLLFLNIFLTVFLTDNRDIHEFTDADWLIFTVMGFVELVTLILTFYAADRCGKHLLPMEHLRYRTYGAVIRSCPLPSNYVRQVYTDENYGLRVVVCGFPNDKGVYFCKQEFNSPLQLETNGRSEIYPDESCLPEEILSLIDISEHFPCAPE